MHKTSPTQRSLKLLRDEGYSAWIVEHWNAFVGIRQDLFGFIDIVAIREDVPGVLAIQTTSGNNLSARRKKISDNGYAKIWLKAGNKIQIHGWRKLKEGKRSLWKPILEDYQG